MRLADRCKPSPSSLVEEAKEEIRVDTKRADKYQFTIVKRRLESSALIPVFRSFTSPTTRHHSFFYKRNPSLIEETSRWVAVSACLVSF